MIPAVRKSKPTRQNLIIYLALTGGILIIGFSPVLLRWAGAPGTVSSFYRMLYASVAVSLPFFYRTKRGYSQLTRSGVRYAIFGGVFFSLDLCLWSTGVMLSGATMPTLLSNLAPVFVGIGAWLFFKERQTSRFWIGLAISVLGSFLVLKQDLNLSPEIGLGAILGLLSALFYGLYYLATQGGRASLDTVSYFWITATTAAVVLGLANLLLGEPLTGYTLTENLSFLAMGFLVQVFGWLLINYAQGYISASITAATLLIQPLVTGIFANILLDETFTLWHILGGGFVLAGVFMVHFSRNAKKPLDDTLSAVE